MTLFRNLHCEYYRGEKVRLAKSCLPAPEDFSAIRSVVASTAKTLFINLCQAPVSPIKLSIRCQISLVGYDQAYPRHSDRDVETELAVSFDFKAVSARQKEAWHRNSKH